MGLYVSGDFHLGHRKIAAYCHRRFCLSAVELELLDSGAPLRTKNNPNGWQPSLESVARMDDYLIDKINDTVGVDDILWFLGDFCFAPDVRMQEIAKRYRERIKCKVVNLVWGNHDRREIAPLFTSNYSSYELRWGSRKVVMSHCAHAVWEGSHRGAYHLYAHSHTTAENNLDIFSVVCDLRPNNLQDLLVKLQKVDLQSLQPSRRSIDVGIDNAFRLLGEYRPFSFEEIDHILAARQGSSIDNHR
jgi:calcineurin-like phosphoesterase family protein